MKKLILSLLVAVGLISSASADMFGTNNSQTTFIIPSGDSIDIGLVLPKNPDLEYSLRLIASNVVNTVTNTIVYVKNTPKIVSVTNSITNTISVDIWGGNIQGPASITLSNCSINYRYYKGSKSTPVLMSSAGNTNPLTINIPAGKCFWTQSVYFGGNLTTYSVYINGIHYDAGPDGFRIPSVYGPATLTLLPSTDGSVGYLYLNYIIQ
jgi:hypothetical protein